MWTRLVVESAGPASTANATRVPAPTPMTAMRLRRRACAWLMVGPRSRATGDEIPGSRSMTPRGGRNFPARLRTVSRPAAPQPSTDQQRRHYEADQRQRRVEQEAAVEACYERLAHDQPQLVGRMGGEVAECLGGGVGPRQDSVDR